MAPTPEHFMRRVLQVARRGFGRVAPNPPVGAVAVRGGKILGEGWHRRHGDLHAEAHLITRVGKKCRGADLYVTLEPCCHHGKTPPCTDAVIEAGFRRVFYAVADPNELTAGKGPRKLRRAGIEVERGLLEEEARRQLAPYLSSHSRSRPLVTAKWAMTLDGRIASATGDSKWISPEALREYTRRERSDYDAILIGRGTAAADDPELTTARSRGASPLRIVLDSTLQLPVGGRLVRACDRAPLLIACGRGATSGRRGAGQADAWRAAGAELLELPSDRSGLSLKTLLRTLDRRGVHHLLVEGGSGVHGSFLDLGLVDRLQVVVGPRIVGGAGAPGPVAGSGVDRMRKALEVTDGRARAVGGGWIITGDLTPAASGLTASRD